MARLAQRIATILAPALLLLLLFHAQVAQSFSLTGLTSRNGLGFDASTLGPDWTGFGISRFLPALGIQRSAGNDIDYPAPMRQYFAATSGPHHGCHTLRPRVEWRALTPTQRQRWIDAVWCLAKRPSVLAAPQTNLTGLRTSLLSDFTLVHIRLFQTIHFVAAFLPWHRAYLIARERAMQSCGYDGPTPYWDWSIDADAGSLADSAVLSDDAGVGGFGDPGLRGEVIAGPFARLPLEYVNAAGTPEIVPTYRPHYLNRTFGTGLARGPPNRTRPLQEDAYSTKTVQRILVTSATYAEFQPRLEGLRGRLDSVGMGPHTAIHRALGGDMPFPQSANDPAFFLHHANVDRLWWLWQRDLSLNDTRRFGSRRAESLAFAAQARIKVAKGGGIADDGLASLSLGPLHGGGKLYDFGGNTVEYRNDTSGGPPASLSDVQSLLGLILPNIPTYQLMDTSRPPLCYYYI